jgi:protein phosphatase
MGFFSKLNDVYRQIVGRGVPNPAGLGAFRVLGGSKTVIGNYRDNNEDRIYTSLPDRVFLVADGMGGQAAGEQASQLAVEIVPKELDKTPFEVTEPNEVRDCIRRAILVANDSILHQGNSDPNTQNMGTTVVLAHIRGGKMYIAHIGDSRAYLVRQGKIERITTDHNLAQALYEANSITAAELDTHKYRHVLWKYLGSREVGEGPDIAVIDIEPGDRFLLATDGLTGSIHDKDLATQISSTLSPQACAEKLVQMALDNGSRDNVSCIVLHVESDQQPSSPVPGNPTPSTSPPSDTFTAFETE